ncbi:MAG: hypothetical protein AAB547_03680 [Patescibacteria group bacterium]
MRICIIIDDASAYSSKRFSEEAARVGHELSFVSWKDLVFDGGKNTISTGRGTLLDSFDAAVLRSSVNSITPLSLVAEYCKNKDVPLLNDRLYLRLQNTNKLRQQILFQTNDIPCLETFYGERLAFPAVKKRLGVPFVAKIANGSLGKQVFKIRSQKEFLRFTKTRERDRQLYIFQKYYRISGDYRVFIIGENVFGPVKRTAPKGEWRTNVWGAKHERAGNETRVLALASSVGKKLDIDFAGIDILIDVSGQARVIEINTMAQFKVFENVFPEINVVGEILKLLGKKGRGMRRSKV